MTTAATDDRKALVVELPDNDESDSMDKMPADASGNSDKAGSTNPTTATTAAASTGDTSAKSGRQPTTSTTEPPPATEPEPVVVAVPVAADAAFVANRITFGVSPAVSNQLASLGAGGFIEDQLNRTGPDRSVESRLGRFVLFGKGPKATYEALRSAKGARLQQELVHSNILRATFSRNQLYEMMCHLWMDHFNVNILNNNRTRHLHVDYQENVIRPHAMGSFRRLLRATAESPAMLNYLNNDTSNARSEQGVNENYGRELLELHTLGIDESGAQVYNEADVVAAANAMSGWSMVTNRKAGNYSEFEFRPRYHHDGDVSLLGGAWSSQGTSGKQTGESMLDFLATHPSTARHIAYKICRRFVGDAPPAGLVASTAKVFLDNNTELVPTLRHVLRSPEFAASAGQKFRRPFEHLVAALRAVDAQVPDNPTSKGAAQLRSALTATDHLPWGWPAPNGYPDSAAEWLDGSGLSARWTLGARLARNRITDVRVDHRAATPQAATVGELIAGLGRRFGMGTLSQADIDAIATANRMSAGDGASSVGDSIGDVIALVLAHPIFQIR